MDGTLKIQDIYNAPSFNDALFSAGHIAHPKLDEFDSGPSPMVHIDLLFALKLSGTATPVNSDTKDQSELIPISNEHPCMTTLEIILMAPSIHTKEKDADGNMIDVWKCKTTDKAKEPLILEPPGPVHHHGWKFRYIFHHIKKHAVVSNRYQGPDGVAIVGKASSLYKSMKQLGDSHMEQTCTSKEI